MNFEIPIEASQEVEEAFSQSTQTPYPFKSKFKKYKKDYPETRLSQTTPDKQLDKKLLQKPSYGKHPGTWEIDHVFNLVDNGDSWLFCININTRFLVIYETPEISESVIKCLTELKNQYEVRTIKCDGSNAYNSYLAKAFYSDNNIEFYSNSSKYTNHNRIVDRVSRTIRDGLYNILEETIITKHELNKVVEMYNNTYHNSIQMKPIEMMEDDEKEWKYIRKCDQKVRSVKEELKKRGILSYEPGVQILVHLNERRTSNKFQKKRRIFNQKGTFIGYEHGNVKVNINGKEVVVPMYCTRPLS